MEELPEAPYPIDTNLAAHNAPRRPIKGAPAKQRDDLK